MGVSLNELECVAFLSSKNFTQESTPGEETECIICVRKPSLRVQNSIVANGLNTWPRIANTQTI